MRRTVHFLLLPLFWLPVGGEAETPDSKAQERADIRLYKLDCGHFDIPDLAPFGSEGEYDGRPGELAVMCFLLRHPDGDLLWDAGLPDSVADAPGGKQDIQGLAIVSVPITLASELEKVGVTPQEIEYLALSHSHFDHVGNVAAFAKSHVLISKSEREYMYREEAREEPFFDLVAPIENSRTTMFTGEYDVFGDGSVKIIETPGHTPGHSVLLVNLKKEGPVLLTGDLYHMEQSRTRRIAPGFNFDKKMTLDSMERFEAMAKKFNARVIIQHSIEEQKRLPATPNYLD